MYNHSLVMRTREAGSYSATAWNKADVWNEAQTREKNPDFLIMSTRIQTSSTQFLQEKDQWLKCKQYLCVCMIY